MTTRLIIATDPNGVIGVKYRHTEDGSQPVGGLVVCCTRLRCDCEPKMKEDPGAPPRNWIYRWKMPWYYKQDLRRFKKVTMGGVLVMGRRTFDSLPGVLPGRHHLLLTRDDGFFQNDLFTDEKTKDCVSYANSFDEAIHDLGEYSEGRDIWIAGGAEIYRMFLEGGAVEEIDHTIVPEVKFDNDFLKGLKGDQFVETIRFDLAPVLEDFELVNEEVNPLDERLTHRRYRCPLPAFN